MRILFSAGGTGGHLYPAIALADFIKKNDNDVQILFVGANKRLEATKVNEYNYDFKGLDIKSPSGNIIKKSLAYLDIYKNITKAKDIVKEFNPDIVIGFGGYTTFSILKAAQQLNIPTIIHEQNSIIGKANKQLLKKANYLVSSYDLKITNDKIVNLGNPVSYNVVKSEVANLNDYDLSNSSKTILIVMGSQGSQTIDEVIYQYLTKIQEIDYQIIYITGHNYYERYQNIEFDNNIKILAYSDNLVSLIKAADLIISRAGASILTEIISANKANILIPSIHVTNNHQYHNAMNLVEKDCSLLWLEDKDLINKFNNDLVAIIHNDDLLEKMEVACKALKYNDSAMLMYQLIKKVVNQDAK